MALSTTFSFDLLTYQDTKLKKMYDVGEDHIHTQPTVDIYLNRDDCNLVRSGNRRSPSS